MGMFDTIHVDKPTKVNIPVLAGGYQSKSMGCSLGHIGIDEAGLLSVISFGAKDHENKDAVDVREGTYSTTCLGLHGDDDKGVWQSYEVVVLNNQILRVIALDGKVLYLDPLYPVLAEPEPDNHFLALLVNPGTQEKEFRVMQHCRGKHRSAAPSPYGNLFQKLLSTKHHL